MADRFLPIYPSFSLPLGHGKQISFSMPFFFRSLGYGKQISSSMPFPFFSLGYGRQISSYIPFLFSSSWAWKANFFLYALLFSFPWVWQADFFLYALPFLPVWVWQTDFFLYALHFLVPLGMADRFLSLCPSFSLPLGHGKQISFYMPFLFSSSWAWKADFLLYTLPFLFLLGMESRFLPICPSFFSSLGMAGIKQENAEESFSHFLSILIAYLFPQHFDCTFISSAF